MSTLYRIIFRLAVVASVFAGGALILALAIGSVDDLKIAALVLGLASTSVWALAWIVKPERSSSEMNSAPRNLEKNVLRVLVVVLGVFVSALFVYSKVKVHRAPLVNSSELATVVTPPPRGHFVPDLPINATRSANAASQPPRGRFIPDPPTGTAKSTSFDIETAVAVPNAFSKFDCVTGQVVRYDRTGRAICLTQPKDGNPWMKYQDAPLANRLAACSADLIKVYDDERNEYCVPLERVDHLGEAVSHSVAHVKRDAAAGGSPQERARRELARRELARRGANAAAPVKKATTTN
jgi:hypothetical protein